MHLHGEEHSAASDRGSECDNKMTTSAVDVRLRRQKPVSVKPPRLRLSATTTTSSAANKMSISRHSAGSAQIQGRNSTSSSSASNNRNNNTCEGSSRKIPDGTMERVVTRSSRSSSVSKISGSTSCGRRIRGRASRAGITASTFTPATSSADMAAGFGSGNTQSLSKSVATGLSRSCENVRTAVFSTAALENGSGPGRPLIHHQRHNLKNRFQLLKTLGEGTYGKVKLAMEKSSGEQVAIKYIKKTKIVDGADLARIRREIQILSSLRHSHVVNIREVFEKKDKIVLVMDYAQGGELYDYLNKMGRLGEWEARRIFRQIVSAIHCCHQNGIVHRDLKLENIILDDAGNVKIADFGLANYYSHSTMLSTFCGSPLYASPEIVNGRSYYGPEVDVWSLGVILYTLVYGSMPFESNSLVSLKQQISDGDYRQPSKPSDAAGLIRHMLTVTPSRRATMDDALRHWWVNFGHPHMPNGQAYNPCELDDTSVGGGGVTDVTAQGSPTVSLSSLVKPPETSVLACPPPTSDGQTPLTTDTSLVSSQFQRPRCHSLDDSLPAAIGKEFVVAPPPPLPPPPAIIHQRNQSSLSSDSDAELELLRSSRWDQSRDVDRGSGGTTQPHPPLQRRRGWRFGHHKTGSGPLDSTGNSVNSSGSASPASNTEDNAGGLEGDDNYQRQTYSTMESQVNACSMVGRGENFVSPNVLKLPPALMDILGGCSEKSLTALLTPDPDTNLVSFNPFDLLDDPNSVAIKRLNSNPNCSNELANPTVSSSNVPAASPSLESNCVANTSDVTNNNVHSSPHVGPIQTPLAPSTSSLPCPSTTTSSTADPFVFDSERKPKRSILKRRGKFSGPDPAKKTENGQKDVEEDNHIPKSGGGHLPRRLPSFRDEAHGIFASKHRASQLLEEAAGTLAPESCSSALVHSHSAPWGKHSETDSVTSGASPLQYVSLTAEDFSLTSPLPQRTTHPEQLSQSEQEFTTIHISPPIPPYPQSTASVPDQCSPNGSHLVQLVPPDLVSSEAAMITSKNFDSHTLACHDKSYNADLANGNYSDLLEAPLQNGYSSLSDSSDAHSITALADGQVTKAAVDNLISPFLSDLSIVCDGNSNPTPAKSDREIATCLEAKTTTQGDCSANSPAKPQSANPSHRSSASNSSGDSAYESSSVSSHPTALLVSACSSSSSNSKVVRRTSNILRSSQLEQARNRLSVSSIGSNSSADILDLSYDSGDGEHFVNLEREVLEQAASHKLPGAYDMDTHVLPDKTSPPGLDTLDILTGVPNDESTSPGQHLKTVEGVKTVSTTELMDPWTGVSQQSAQFVVSENIDLMIFPDDEEEGPPVKFDGAELPKNGTCQVAMENTSPTSNKLSKGNACDVGNFLDCGNVNGEDQTWEAKTVSPGLDLLQDVSHGKQDQTDRPDQVTNITESCSPLLYRLAREAQTWL